MQTRRKIVAGTGSQEHASPRFCRQQRKMTVIAEKKVRELITSAKKQKSDGIHSKKIRDVDEARDLNSMYDMVDETRVAYEASLDYTRSDDKAAKCETETIFSPTYHYPKDVCGGIPDKVNFVELFKSDNQTEHHGQLTEETKADAFVGNLSSEVSAIYLAMQHSKLECVDEHSQDTMSADGCVEPDDSDEFDDFDPYSFIKELPDLSAVVPRYRPVLLPKQTRSCPSISLVLDLDETLVHSTLEPCQDADFSFPVNFNLKEHMIFVRCRPYLKDFMERVAGLFETIIFTASQSIYAEQLLNVLDPKRKLFRHRVYRESCVYVEGNYLKDLSVLGRDLAHVLIIDNSPQAFGFQLDNGIPIESWFEDRNDQALLSLLPFLESLVGVDDVRPMIAKKFNLRAKVASAACLSVDFRN